MADDSNAPLDEFQELCRHMGMTLAIWQRLEDEHFLLFVKLLGSPKREICSAIYHGIPSFEGRRMMVDRVASFSSLTADQRTEWERIHKALEVASTDRNKIAHYSVDYEILERTTNEDGSMTFDLGSPHLRPSQHNILKVGSPDKPGYKLTPVEMKNYMDQFIQLAETLKTLSNLISVHPPQQGLGLGSGLLPYLG
jgi:hypothetical protein